MFSLIKVLNITAKNCFELSLKNASFLAAAKTSLDRRFMIVDVNISEIDLKTEEFKYPLVWLRDNCQCSSCFHAQSKSRIIDWTKFDIRNAQPKSISVSHSLNVLLKNRAFNLITYRSISN